MSVAIEMPGQGGIQSSKLIKMVKGAVAGGSTGGIPGAIAGGVSGANPNSPLSKAMGLYDNAQALAGNGSNTGATPSEDSTIPAADGASSMDRAVQTQQQNPSYQVKNGMNLLMKTPASELGMSPELHAQAFETLARAHHFGYGGGLDDAGSDQSVSST